MKANFKHYYEDGNITLSVSTEELSSITLGLQDQLKKQNDYLIFYKEELINPVVECNAEIEIQKCNAKIGQLESMLSELQS
jgi:hypothetical protein